MPADRLFHPRAGHSQKVGSLTDLEFRVWWTYELAADDFGVMRRSPVVLQAANVALARRPPKTVEKALDKLVEVGLVVDFEHQGDWFICQLDWQDFQKVRYPRESHLPMPPPEILLKCSGETQALFAQKSGKKSGEDPSLPRAGGRETANGLRLTADANGLRLPTKNSGGAGAGQHPRDHLSHAACDATFSRCVPAVVHAKLVNKLAPKYTGDRGAAATALKAWYPVVWASLPDSFVMPSDDFKFWQAQFDASFASPVPSASRVETAKSNVPGADRTAAYLRNQEAR